MTFINWKTKKVVVVDQVYNRLKRLREAVKYWAEILEGVRRDNDLRLVMLTLTYKPGVEWEPNHIRDFMIRVKRYYDEPGQLLGYAWVAELQRRGAVHYHVILYLKKGSKVPKPDKVGWWRHGMSSREDARTPFYLLKYTGKEYQKDFDKFPRGIRAFAVWMSDEAMSTRLRYCRLKPWEKAVVDTDGWEALPIWKRLLAGSSGWQAWGFFGTKEEAEKDEKSWQSFFEKENSS